MRRPFKEFIIFVLIFSFITIFYRQINSESKNTQIGLILMDKKTKKKYIFQNISFKKKYVPKIEELTQIPFHDYDIKYIKSKNSTIVFKCNEINWDPPAEMKILYTHYLFLILNKKGEIIQVFFIKQNHLNTDYLNIYAYNGSNLKFLNKYKKKNVHYNFKYNLKLESIVKGNNKRLYVEMKVFYINYSGDDILKLNLKPFKKY